MLGAMRRFIPQAAFIILVLSWFSQPLFSLPYEGTPDEQRVIDELAAAASTRGYGCKIQPVIKQDAYHSFSRILAISIPGKTSERRMVILPVSMAPGLASQDYDPGMARTLCLAILDLAQKTGFHYSLDLLLAGGHTGLEDGPGIRFIQDAGLPGPDEPVLEFGAFVPGRAWHLDMESARSLVPAWFFDLLGSPTAATATNLDNSPLDFLAPALVPNRVLWGKQARDGHSPWIVIRSANIGTKTPSPDASLALVAGFLAENPEGQESNPVFTFFPVLFNERFWIVSESSLVLILFTWTAVALLLIFQRNRRRIYLRSLARSFPVMLLISGLWYVLMLLVLFLIPKPAHSAAATVSPVFFALRLFNGIAGLILASCLLRGFLPRQGAFYSAAALFLAFLLLYVGAGVGLVLVLPILAGISGLILSMVFRNRLVKTILWGVSAFYMGGLASLTGAWMSGRNLDDWLFLDPAGFNLLVVFILLPWLFQGYRIVLLWPVPGRHRFVRIALGLLAIGLLDLGLFSTVYGPLPAQSDQGTDTLKIMTPDDLARQGSKVTVAKREFLNRKILTIQSSSQLPVRNVAVKIAASGALTVYSCNFPVKYASPDTAWLQIGQNPPLPLKIELVLPRDSSLAVSIEFAISGPLNEVTRRLAAALEL